MLNELTLKKIIIFMVNKFHGSNVTVNKGKI